MFVIITIAIAIINITQVHQVFDLHRDFVRSGQTEHSWFIKGFLQCCHPEAPWDRPAGELQARAKAKPRAKAAAQPNEATLALMRTPRRRRASDALEPPAQPITPPMPDHATDANPDADADADANVDADADAYADHGGKGRSIPLARMQSMRASAVSWANSRPPALPEDPIEATPPKCRRCANGRCFLHSRNNH